MKNFIQNEVSKEFYIVETLKRTFYLNNKENIGRELENDEKSYNVIYVEYIGAYEGKSDVLCIQTSTNKDICTVVDQTTVAYFTEENKRWKMYYNNNSLSKYYDIFREKGLVLNNDIYKREELFRKEVAKQLQNLLQQKKY